MGESICARQSEILMPEDEDVACQREYTYTLGPYHTHQGVVYRLAIYLYLLLVLDKGF